MSGRAFHDWRKAAELGQTIDAVRTSIVTSLSTTDPRAAVARLWQIVDADAKIMERVDDSSGVVSTALMMAIPDLGIAITKAGVDDFEALAEHVHDSFLGNRYGILDRLVTTLAEPLGLNGRADLKRRFAATLANLPPAECDGKRDYDVSSKRAACTEGMMAIADAADDVEGYLAAAEQHPYMRAHVDEAAKRLLKAGRAAEALAWLDRTPPNYGQLTDPTGDGLIGLKLQALDALGRKDEAQALRWTMFERHLLAHYLREHVRRLPDFEDTPVINRAIARALTHPCALTALLFLVDWPDPQAASKLVLARRTELDGRHYDFLNRAIERLDEKYPVATTVLLRAKIDSVLIRASSTQYVWAARDLARAAVSASRVDTAALASADLPPHNDYVASLKIKHGRKVSFWDKVKTD